jgi:aspartate carbamoyltransferase regulatory subunit
VPPAVAAALDCTNPRCISGTDPVRAVLRA